MRAGPSSASQLPARGSVSLQWPAQPSQPGRQATKARPSSGRTACHTATCMIGNWILHPHPTGCLLSLLQRSFSCAATSSSPVTRHPSPIRSSLSAPLLSASVHTSSISITHSSRQIFQTPALAIHTLVYPLPPLRQLGNAAASRRVHRRRVTGGPDPDCNTELIRRTCLPPPLSCTSGCCGAFAAVMDFFNDAASRCDAFRTPRYLEVVISMCVMPLYAVSPSPQTANMSLNIV